MAASPCAAKPIMLSRSPASEVEANPAAPNPLYTAQKHVVGAVVRGFQSRDSILLRLTNRRYPASTFDRFFQLHKPAFVTEPKSSGFIAAVTQHLTARGCRQRGDWLNGSCPFPECHAHGDARPSFGFNLASGCGHCFRCGPLPLRDLCITLKLDPLPRRSHP